MAPVEAMRAAASQSPSTALALLFTDIEGSTRRWEQAPDAMERALARHDRILREVCAANEGHVFKTVGDAFCVAFADPLAAVVAAIEAQLTLAAEDFSAVDGLRVRMAIHAGEVRPRDDDYFGPPVNRVARILLAAHGGQVLLSGAAAAAARGALPPGIGLVGLGRHRLKDLIHPEDLYQLTGPELPAEFPPPRSLSAMSHNLPQQATSFIGREQELAEIAALLRRHRLVTVLGTGGLGKTRLTLQAAAEMSTEFADGVWLAELAPLNAPELVAEALAALFGLPVQGSRSATEVVVGFLRQRQLLLVLDNCEHVIDEAARLAAAILRSCPRVTILASSREGLAIAGECLYRLPALSFPAQALPRDAAAARQYGAVRLFVERAESALDGFVLTDEIAPVVAEICRRLDGIALAIELAVPRLKLLKPAELLQRLEDRFRLLTGGDRTALPRQQTLRGLIDWSYDLLAEPERLVLRRLSVFGGSFTIDTAGEVAGSDPIEAWEVFDLVAALVDKSLVVPVLEGGGASRYRLLESTRAYGLEKLAESDEADAVPGRLLGYLLALYREADDAHPTTPSEAWLADYAPDLENLRAGLAWAFGAAGDAASGVELVAYTGTLWEELSLAPEQRRWFALAGARIGAATPPRTEALIRYVLAFTIWHGQRRNLEALREVVELFRLAGDPLRLGKALTAAGMALARPGDVAEAEAQYRAAEAVLRPLGPTKTLGNLLNVMATARLFAGDAAGARALFEESRTLALALGSRSGVLMVTSNLADLEFAEGRLEQAIERAREAEAACRRSGNRGVLGLVCANLAGYLLAAGETEAGRATAQEGAKLTLALGQDYYFVICLEHLALALAIGGEVESAARFAGYGAAYYGAEGRGRESTEQASWERLMERLGSAMPERERERCMAEGAAWTLDQAAAAAERIPTAAPSALTLGRRDPIASGSEPEHVLHAVEAGRPAGNPERRP